MWQDMNLYWAWRGAGQPTSRPPYPKVVEHAKITLHGEMPVTMHLAVTVIDGGVRREVCRDELASLLRAGATAEMP